MIDCGDRYMACDECPIGRDDVERRYERLNGYLGEDWQPEYCGCDKNGGYYFYMGGYCEDAWASKEKMQTAGRHNTGRAYRRKQKYQKQKRLISIVSRYYIPHAGYLKYDWVDGDYIPVGKYVKYPKNSNKQRWMKRYSNKIVRNKNLPHKGNAYRRHYDYWWTMY